MNTSRIIGFAIGAAVVAASCGASNPDTLVQQGAPEPTAPSVETINDTATADEPADREATTTIAATTTTTAAGGDPVQCIVRLHGKGGNGGDTSIDGNGVRTLMPSGNEDGWGARQWIYFPNDRYVEARGIVGEAITAEGCTAVVINGFSNGGAFAASMFCDGETFGGVVRGYVIDDPVTDTATDGCAPAANVDVVMYWTTAIAQPADTDCAAIDWTCAGGTTVDVSTYASRMGTSVTPSPYTEHQWFWDAPEVLDFLG